MNLNRYVAKENPFVRYPFGTAHLAIWRDFWEPVVLVVWDAKNDVAYWEIAQEPLRPWDITSKSAYCNIPIENTLDETGIRRLAARTRRRHHRFEREKQGAQILVEMLQKLLNLKIDYDPQHGMLYVQYPDGTHRVTVFGKTAEEYARRATESGMSVEDWVNETIANGFKMWKALHGGATLQIRDVTTGAVTEEWDEEGMDSHIRQIEMLDE